MGPGFDLKKVKEQRRIRERRELVSAVWHHAPRILAQLLFLAVLALGLVRANEWHLARIHAKQEAEQVRLNASPIQVRGAVWQSDTVVFAPATTGPATSCAGTYRQKSTNHCTEPPTRR